MISKEINLWVIPSFYWSEDYPLRGIFFKEQAEAIAKNGIKTTIIYPELRSLKDFSFSKLKKFHFQKTETLEGNLTVIRVKRWNLFPTNSPQYNLGLKLWVREVIKLVKQKIENGDRPDIIHAHCCLGAGIAAYEIFEEFKIPYIITEHSTSFHDSSFKGNTYNILKKTIENSFKTYAVSSLLRNSMIDKIHLSPSIIEVLPNFIDTDFFVPFAKKKVELLMQRKFRFLTVSGISERKKIDRIILAFNEFYKENNNIELLIGGENLGKEVYLKKLVKTLDLEESIKFIGPLTRSLVRKNMQESDCFVLASDTETFGVVLIEAMSCGKPVVSTKSGGPEDIVTKDCGILVEKQVNDLFIGMKHLYQNRETFDGNKIRQIVIENFSKKSNSHKYLSVYREVIKR